MGGAWAEVDVELRQQDMMALLCDSVSQMLKTSPCPRLFPASHADCLPRLSADRLKTHQYVLYYYCTIPARCLVSKMVLNGSTGGGRSDELGQGGVMRK